jgi:hypothetical protein
MSAVSRATLDEKSSAHIKALQRLLLEACKKHRAETGGDMWGFTIDAIIYLAEWVGLSQPVLARDFLIALSERAAAVTRDQTEAADHKIIASQLALFAALRAQRTS